MGSIPITAKIKQITKLQSKDCGCGKKSSTNKIAPAIVAAVGPALVKGLMGSDRDKEKSSGETKIIVQSPKNENTKGQKKFSQSSEAVDPK